MDKEIVISIKTVIFVLLLILGLFIVYRLAPVFVVLLIATILVVALEPAVEYFMSFTFMNKPLHRGTAVVLTYVLFLVALVFLMTMIFPPVIRQAQLIVERLPGIIESLSLETSFPVVPDFSAQLASLTESAFSVTYSLFGAVFAFFTTFIISLYMSLDWDNIKKRFVTLWPVKNRKEIKSIIEDVETNLGNWVKGQIVLMIVVGALSFVGLLVLDIDYPLGLALLSGVLEAVPMVGPLVSAVIAGIVGLSDSPIKGLSAVALFTIIQQLENNFLVPKIMEKVSGFSPLIIIVAMMIGGTFFGVVGVLLAVPLTMVLAIIGRHLIKAFWS